MSEPFTLLWLDGIKYLIMIAGICWLAYESRKNKNKNKERDK